MTGRYLRYAVIGLFACGDAGERDARPSVERAAPAALDSVDSATAPPLADSVSAPDSATAPSEAVTADTALLRRRVDSITALAKARPDLFRFFARRYDIPGLVAVEDSLSWPDDTETSFITLTDERGTVVFHAEIPTSESGDWHMESEHFFDAQGRTIYHRAHVSGFGSECAQIVRETVLTFFDPSTGQPIARSSSVTDGDGAPIRDVSGCFLRIRNVPKPKRSLADLPTP